MMQTDANYKPDTFAYDANYKPDTDTDTGGETETDNEDDNIIKGPR